MTCLLFLYVFTSFLSKKFWNIFLLLFLLYSFLNLKICLSFLNSYFWRDGMNFGLQWQWRRYSGFHGFRGTHRFSEIAFLSFIVICIYIDLEKICFYYQCGTHRFEILTTPLCVRNYYNMVASISIV